LASSCILLICLLYTVYNLFFLNLYIGLLLLGGAALHRLAEAAGPCPCELVKRGSQVEISRQILDFLPSDSIVKGCDIIFFAFVIHSRTIENNINSCRTLLWKKLRALVAWSRGIVLYCQPGGWSYGL
jgi:hypothetical protein